MKKIFNYSLLVISLVIFASCDSGFDELNTTKTNPLSLDPVFQLNNAVVNINGGGFAGGSPLIYDLGAVQQLISPNSGVLTGANYNQDNRNATQTLWQSIYRNVIRNTIDVIKNTKDLTGTAERTNLYNMGRILQAYGFMILTDEYGDIPYTEAGKGYIEANYFPAYDSQEDIYASIIQELSQASAALNPATKTEPADVLYGGNIARWKKFANSLLLRAGMRLSKVNPTQAAQIVGSLTVADLILENADNAVVRYDANYQNGFGNTLNGSEAANFYLAQPFVDQLKSTNDPRLSSIAVRYKGSKSGTDQSNTINGNPPAGVTRTTAPADQIGMPVGHDNSTIPAVATGLGLASFYDFSQVDRRRLTKQSAPYFIVSASQTNLLLAEASHRGWIAEGTVEGYYTDGIRRNMEQMAIYDPGATIATVDIDTYLTNNPFVDDGTDETAFEQINTQYWIASFLNGPEVFANYRRSGYPQLSANPYPGREVEFIRRLTYPNSEGSVNSENVSVAIERMGPDRLDTRVWWDVE
jgi:hypothetical protein